MSAYARLVFNILGWLLTATVLGLFVAVLTPIIFEGFENISFSFLTADPIHSGRAGGIYPVLVSTVYIVLICLISVVPLGLLTSLYLYERSEKPTILSRGIRVCIDILAGTPSIVFGLFGNMFFSQVLGFGFSILSGGLTLACMVLPFFVKIAEIGMRQVPKEQILSARALSLSRWTVVRKIVLPLSMPALVGGLVLSFGRAISETAALIFTSGYVDRMPESWLDSGRSISVHIYDLAMNVPGGNQNAYASALVLIVCLVIIFVLARWLTDRVVVKGAII